MLDAGVCYCLVLLPVFGDDDAVRVDDDDDEDGDDDDDDDDNENEDVLWCRCFVTLIACITFHIWHKTFLLN